MTVLHKVSKQTRDNWWIAASLFTTGLVSALSGLYFFFGPERGFKGGRNPYYNFTFIFTNETWKNIHTWGGILMIAIAIIHIPAHWHWFVNLGKKAYKIATGKNKKINNRSLFNLLVNTILGLCILVTATSGLYFFLNPGPHRRIFGTETFLLLTRTTWKDIHTWSGIIMILMVITHSIIHWKWITKVTKNIYSNTFTFSNKADIEKEFS